MLKQVAVALVRFLGGGVACILAHRPEPATIHRRLDTARVGILAWIAQLLCSVPVAKVLGRIERLDRDLGAGGEGRLAFGRALNCAAIRRRAPIFGASACRWGWWRCGLTAIRLRGFLLGPTLCSIAH